MIVIVDSGIANVGSIASMLRKIGAPARVSRAPEDIAAADKLILPGVGAFDAGMRQLRDLRLIEPLTEAVMEHKRPVLGICLGMQLMSQGSEEGNVAGLGWIDGSVVRFRPFSRPDGKILPIPHMGWNRVRREESVSIFHGLDEDPRFYFVHSYHFQTDSAALVAGRTTYGYEFPSAINHDNIWGVQFHPEKSHRFGLQLLRNFVIAA